jgi:hypothetical protein
VKRHKEVRRQEEQEARQKEQERVAQLAMLADEAR